MIKRLRSLCVRVYPRVRRRRQLGRAFAEDPQALCSATAALRRGLGILGVRAGSRPGTAQRCTGHRMRRGGCRRCHARPAFTLQHGGAARARCDFLHAYGKSRDIAMRGKPPAGRGHRGMSAAVRRHQQQYGHSIDPAGTAHAGHGCQFAPCRFPAHGTAAVGQQCIAVHLRAKIGQACGGRIAIASKSIDGRESMMA